MLKGVYRVVAIYFASLLFAFSSNSTYAAPSRSDKTVGAPQFKIAPKFMELNQKGIVALQFNDYKFAEKLFREAVTADSNRSDCAV